MQIKIKNKLKSKTKNQKPETKKKRERNEYANFVYLMKNQRLGLGFIYVSGKLHAKALKSFELPRLNGAST